MPKIERFTFIERTFSGLSLAVVVRDKTTKDQKAVGRVDVALNGRSAVKNLSGNFVFLGLEDGHYEVRVAAHFYLPKNFDVTIPSETSPPGGEIPVADPELRFRDLKGALLTEVTLIPDVTYPFSSGATLIRGQVIDADDDPIANALISVVGDSVPGNALNFGSNSDGQFVLLCNRLTRDRIREINGFAFDGSRDLVIASGGSEEALSIEDGTAKFVTIVV